MASRAVGFAASRSAAAADSEATVAMGSRKTTKTTVYTSDGSGGLKKETHTHVESSGSQGWRIHDSDIITNDKGGGMGSRAAPKCIAKAKRRELYSAYVLRRLVCSI